MMTASENPMMRGWLAFNVQPQPLHVHVMLFPVRQEGADLYD